jgi:histidinol-phosphate aminotransferase
MQTSSSSLDGNHEEKKQDAIDSYCDNNNNNHNHNNHHKRGGGGIAARLARPNILELQPYRCARDDYNSGILLDANENAFGPTSLPTPSIPTHDNYLTLERYPDPYQHELKDAFAKYRGYGLTSANIFCGVGSDEAIDMLMRIFCTPGQDNILTTPPTYGMYKVCAKVNDVEVVPVPLSPDFDLRIPEVSRCCCCCCCFWREWNRSFIVPSDFCFVGTDA